MSTLVIGEEGTSQFIGIEHVESLETWFNYWQVHHPDFLFFPLEVYSGSEAKSVPMILNT